MWSVNGSDGRKAARKDLRPHERADMKFPAFGNQITLGELIEKLEGCNLDATVYYEFANLHPCGIDSYRGFYEHLAIGYGEEEIKGSDLIALCHDAVLKRFHGWKGGVYLMDKDTPLWSANVGISTSIAITGVVNDESIVYLKTERIDL